MNLNKLFFDFSSQLKNRIGTLTEDSVRYIFFSCMLSQDCDLNHYTLELPFEMMDGIQTPLIINKKYLINKRTHLVQELDLFYKDNNECLCVEFKFHRNPTTSSDYAHTVSAGSVFNDIKRLHLINSNIDSLRKIVVYVTDDEMHNYMSMGSLAKRNVLYRQDLSAFYSASVGSLCHEPRCAPATFNKAANDSLSSSPNRITASITKINNDDFANPSCQSLQSPGNCHIRIYEIN